MLTIFQLFGPELGIHLNLAKCEVFWSSGDQSFKELPLSICRTIQHEGGATLLGSPVYGSDDFYESFVYNKVEKVLQMQAHLEDIDNPQTELLLLRSCLSQCKLNHLL